MSPSLCRASVSPVKHIEFLYELLYSTLNPLLVGSQGSSFTGYACYFDLSMLRRPDIQSDPPSDPISSPTLPAVAAPDEAVLNLTLLKVEDGASARKPGQELVNPEEGVKLKVHSRAAKFAARGALPIQAL